MKYKNSFFLLEMRKDGTYLVVYPAKNGGEVLQLKEILNFLDMKGCSGYDKKDVKKLLDNLGDARAEIIVNSKPIPAYNESAVVQISQDKMTAYMRFYPPSNGGRLMTKNEIYGELMPFNIKYGISEKIIDVFLMARQYCLNIPVARGKKPVPAKDTKIQYLFNTKPLAKPKLLEDGSVDFHELDLFTRVNKGQVLARLIPHTSGEEGKNIFGESIYPNKPKISTLKYGKNISISQDKREIVSNVDGSVSLTDDTVFVSDTYTVPADVDASTGDIDYDGNVIVSGNVRTGFTVKAKGDIQVNGVVEGANLIAGGNIVIKRGVQGLSKGSLTGGGDICAQFFESARVSARGNVLAGSILHSNITSGDKVLVNGRKGFIVGGEIVCRSYVEANTIGNRMETQTIIKVGVNSELYDEMKVLVSEAGEINAEIEEKKSFINTFKTKLEGGGTLTAENIKQIREYKAKIQELAPQYNLRNDRLGIIKKQLEDSKNGSVRVAGYAYRGVTIYIAGSIYIVKDKDAHGWYRIVEGEIKPTTY
mgnify:CR=1 FL=1